MGYRALFLDRDGVINQEVGYLHRAEDVRWVDGIFALCRAAQERGYRLVVVTNQSGIARGYYSTAQFEELMGWMQSEFLREGIRLTGVYHCPYHPEHGLGEFKREHEDRKPGPGMLLRAAREHDLELGESVLVGDRCSDLAATHAAGLKAAYLLAGTEAQGCPQKHVLLRRLDELIELL